MDWNRLLCGLDSFIRREFGIKDPRRWAFEHRRDAKHSVRQMARSYIKVRRNVSVPA
jgi:hypothetical protein